jgi:hypothetical protein
MPRGVEKASARHLEEERLVSSRRKGKNKGMIAKFTKIIKQN